MCLGLSTSFTKLFFQGFILFALTCLQPRFSQCILIKPSLILGIVFLTPTANIALRRFSIFVRICLHFDLKSELFKLVAMLLFDLIKLFTKPIKLHATILQVNGHIPLNVSSAFACTFLDTIPSFAAFKFFPFTCHIPSHQVAKTIFNLVDKLVDTVDLDKLTPTRSVWLLEHNQIEPAEVGANLALVVVKGPLCSLVEQAHVLRCCIFVGIQIKIFQLAKQFNSLIDECDNLVDIDVDVVTAFAPAFDQFVVSFNLNHTVPIRDWTTHGFTGVHVEVCCNRARI